METFHFLRERLKDIERTFPFEKASDVLKKEYCTTPHKQILWVYFHLDGARRIADKYKKRERFKRSPSCN
jgi:hypothetical protein